MKTFFQTRKQHIGVQECTSRYCRSPEERIGLPRRFGASSSRNSAYYSKIEQFTPGRGMTLPIRGRTELSTGSAPLRRNSLQSAVSRSSSSGFRHWCWRQLPFRPRNRAFGPGAAAASACLLPARTTVSVTAAQSADVIASAGCVADFQSRLRSRQRKDAASP